jgi:hypothetical protein
MLPGLTPLSRTFEGDFETRNLLDRAPVMLALA